MHQILLSDIILENLIRNIDNDYEDVANEHILQANSFAVTPDEKKVQAFAQKLLSEISKEVFVKFREITIDALKNDVNALIAELLTDDESEKVITFLKSPVGKKVIRNFDLIRDCYLDAMASIFEKQMDAWSFPEVGEAIIEFARRETPNLLRRDKED
jgi:hypothetical protein